MARVRVTPDAFELVYYDAAEIAALAERVADRVGVPADIEVSIEVDEALPRPLLGSYVDLVDGALSIWCSGGNFEDPHYPRRFSESLAGFELGSDLLRGADRLSPGFSEAPVDGELSDRRRAAWDVSARGRLTRLGFPVRAPRTFDASVPTRRPQHGPLMVLCRPGALSTDLRAPGRHRTIKGPC